MDVELLADSPKLVENGFDLALRGGQQPDSALVIRKLQDIAFRLYASPSYLENCSTPTTPEQLADHDCVLFRARGGKLLWKLCGPGGEVEVSVRGTIASNDLSFVRRTAIAGSGIALLPELVGEPIRQAGQLASVLPKYLAEGNAMYIVYPSTQHLPLKVRAFRDFLLEHFPGLDSPSLRHNPLGGCAS